MVYESSLDEIKTSTMDVHSVLCLVLCITITVLLGVIVLQYYQKRMLVREVYRKAAAADEANLMARDARRVKTRFLTAIGHEFLTPLNSVTGTLSFLHSRIIDPEYSRLIGTAEDSASILSSLMTETIGLCEIESGKFTPKLEEMNLKQCVESSFEILQTLGRKMTVKPVIFDADVPEFVRADCNQIKRVILNLGSLCIKQISTKLNSEMYIKVKTAQKLSDRVVIKIEVHGCGVEYSEERKSELNQPFENIVHVDEFGGTGLSLAISKELVKAMGGNIGTEKLDNMGTLFWFSLPVQSIPSSALESPALLSRLSSPGLFMDTQASPTFGSSASASLLSQARSQLEDYKHHSSFTLHKKAPITHLDTIQETPRQPNVFYRGTALVVEDNQVNWEILRAILAKLGLRGTRAPNGAIGVSKWKLQMKKKPYDFLFMDCAMPVMDGWVATQEIRRFEKETSSKRTPIIGVTANVLESDLDRCFTCGMDSVLKKPVSLNALRSELERYDARDPDMWTKSRPPTPPTAEVSSLPSAIPTPQFPPSVPQHFKRRTSV